jgi:hypothetical protein
MPITRVTISMPSELARKVKKAAGKKPVSAWLTELVDEHLSAQDLEGAWERYIADMAFTQRETEHARARLDRLLKRRRRRAA